MTTRTFIPLHVPYGADTSHIHRWDQRSRMADTRRGEDDNRLVWRIALSDNAADTNFTSLVSTPGGLQKISASERFVFGTARHLGYVGAKAFEASNSSYGLWKKIYVRDALLKLSDFRPSTINLAALSALGLPPRLGCNGKVEAPFHGKRLIVPSLTLLQLIVAVSGETWKLLRHPLNLLLTARAEPGDRLKLQTLRYASKGRVPTPLDLLALAFWCTEDRVESLWRALDSYGTEGWAFVLPDRHEEFSLCFTAFEAGDLIMVDRMYIVPNYHWPNPWAEITLYNFKGEPLLRETGQVPAFAQ